MVTLPLYRMVLARLGCALVLSGGAACAGDTPAPVSSGAAVPSSATAPAAATAGPEVPAKLSLKEALNLALEHNADYKHSLVAVANSESRLRATNQLHHMQLDTNLSLAREQGGNTAYVSNFGPALTLSRPNGSGFTGNALIPGYNSAQENGQAAFDYTLPLIRGHGQGSETRAQLIQARVDTDSARLQHFDNEQGMIERVVQAYYNAVRAKDLLKVSEQAVTIAQQATTDAQKRLDAGLITEIDVTRAQLRLSQTQQSLNSQQQSYLNALDALVLVLGLPVGAQPELTDTVQYMYTPVEQAAAVQSALQNRPELGLIRLSQEGADVQLALAQSRRKPQADVRFNFTSLGFAIFGGGAIAHVLTSLLGLHLSLPVKERALRENVGQAARSRDILDDDYEFRRQQVINEVRTDVRAAQTAKQNIDLLTANLDVAKKSVHIAQRMIEEGLASNRDLLDAQASQTDTESGVLSAKVDYFLTMVSLRRAMGLSLHDYFGLPQSSGSWLLERRLARQGRVPRVYVDTRRPVIVPTGLMAELEHPTASRNQP
jgi:outer membrane protein TolC